MNIIGIAYNFLSIIVLGDYNPGLIGDGAMVHEDSSIYDLAYYAASLLGTV